MYEASWVLNYNGVPLLLLMKPRTQVDFVITGAPWWFTNRRWQAPSRAGLQLNLWSMDHKLSCGYYQCGSMEPTLPNATSMVHQTSCHRLIWSVRFGKLEATARTQASAEQLCSTTVPYSGLILPHMPGGKGARALHAGECCWFSPLVPTHVQQGPLFWAKNLLASHKVTAKVVPSVGKSRYKTAL